MTASVAYTVESPNAPEVAGEGKPRRNHALAVGALVGPPEGCVSAHDFLLAGVKAASGGNFLGHRARLADGSAGDYVWETYDQFLAGITHLGAGICGLGLTPTASLGLFSVNRPEWIRAEQAAFLHNFVTVPLYDTLGKEAIKHIVNQTEMSVVVASGDKLKLLIALADELPTLKHIITMDDMADDVKELAEKSTLTVAHLRSVEAAGKAAPVAATKPTLDDVFTICYTSGTTGLPKGAVLTHRNLLSEVNCFNAFMQKKQICMLDNNDIHISYLPLAHVFERAFVTLIMSIGAKIGFYQGDTTKLLDDIAVLRPTCFISVPRLLNRVYDKVLAGVKAKGGITQFLFNMAYNSKKASLAQGYVSHWLWDRLVFKAVRARLGGRVKCMITGSAPIAPDVMDFLRICFSAEVHEGYGQTETTAGLTLTVSDDTQSGHVGVPFPTCEIKLVDIPSMNYFSTDKPFPRGEICARGNNIFREYYKSEDKTAEAIDKDGWCHTGDIGMWDAKGRLVVIDRVKNIFKLAQGEYIAPERIEGVYQKHEVIAQAFIHGDSLQSALVGVIVPDMDTLPGYAAKAGHSADTHDALVNHLELRAAILKDLNIFGRANDLKGFENVKNIRLVLEPFSMENNLLTPTFKLKRHEAKAKYQDHITEMYGELSG